MAQIIISLSLGDNISNVEYCEGEGVRCSEVDDPNQQLLQGGRCLVFSVIGVLLACHSPCRPPLLLSVVASREGRRQQKRVLRSLRVAPRSKLRAPKAQKKLRMTLIRAL